MNEWYTRQDQDDDWIQKMLDDEEQQVDQKALHDPEKLLELHKTKWSKRWI